MLEFIGKSAVDEINQLAYYIQLRGGAVLTDFTSPKFNPNSIREYMITLLSTLKKIKLKRTELEENLKIWEQRVALATNKNRDDLKTGANRKQMRLKRIFVLSWQKKKSFKKR